MTNPTSNFGWQMPTPTDLVTDLPADFEVFGQAVDTTLADLKGGTSGQVLAKASATDMDFTWTTPEIGDITNITATSPLTGGGSSGAVTVGIQAASTTQSGAVQLSDSTSTTSSTLAATSTAVKAAYDKASTAATTSIAGIVQLSDSTSTTSSVLASTPTATKSAYDLAAAAIPKSTVTTAGDVLYATGSGTVTRLGIGTAGQVLTVNGGATAPAWTTVSSSPTYAGAVIYKTAAQSIPNITATVITYDSEYLDTNGYHSTSSNTGRFTIPSGKAGKYLVTGNLQMAPAISAQVVLSINVNGANPVSINYPQTTDNNVNGVQQLSISAILNLSVGDYVELLCYQGSGGNADIGQYRNWATISLLGA